MNKAGRSSVKRSGGVQTRIKICGLRREEDIIAVNEAACSYAGFIMAPPFWRYVSPEEVKTLRSHLDSHIQAVGVFVDQEETHIAKLLNAGVIDIAQLHGHEDNDYIDRLKSLTDRTVFQAFKVQTSEDIERAGNSHADLILLDGGTGTGTVFDWSLLTGVGRDFLLAGGLSPENIKEALEMVHPWGVDVSSGVETEKKKDAQKIRRFAETVRSITGGTT